MKYLFVFIQYTAQKIKFSFKDFFSRCDQIRWKLQIWSHLLKNSWVENFIFVQWYLQNVITHIMSLAPFIALDVSRRYRKRPVAWYRLITWRKVLSLKFILSQLDTRELVNNPNQQWLIKVIPVVDFPVLRPSSKH